MKTDDYRKALWMATRFYGGQRSGEGPNWLIMDHGSGKDFVNDADGDYNLAGGWHDCGGRYAERRVHPRVAPAQRDPIKGPRKGTLPDQILTR